MWWFAGSVSDVNWPDATAANASAAMPHARARNFFIDDLPMDEPPSNGGYQRGTGRTKPEPTPAHAATNRGNPYLFRSSLLTLRSEGGDGSAECRRSRRGARRRRGVRGVRRSGAAGAAAYGRGRVRKDDPVAGGGRRIPAPGRPSLPRGAGGIGTRSSVRRPSRPAREAARRARRRAERTAQERARYGPASIGERIR